VADQFRVKDFGLKLVRHIVWAKKVFFEKEEVMRVSSWKAKALFVVVTLILAVIAGIVSPITQKVVHWIADGFLVAWMRFFF